VNGRQDVMSGRRFAPKDAAKPVTAARYCICATGIQLVCNRRRRWRKVRRRFGLCCKVAIAKSRSTNMIKMRAGTGLVAA
jgi:hypothetical protein